MKNAESPGYLHADHRDFGVKFLQTALKLLSKRWNDPGQAACFIYLANKCCSAELDATVQEVWETEGYYVGNTHTNEYDEAVGYLDRQDAWNAAVKEAGGTTEADAKDDLDDLPY